MLKSKCARSIRTPLAIAIERGFHELAMDLGQPLSWALVAALPPQSRQP
jgi:hypothetical protein